MNLVSNAIKFTDRGKIAINTTKKEDLSLTGFIENKIKSVSHIAVQGG
jgi:signal transduction histidine kinase